MAYWLFLVLALHIHNCLSQNLDESSYNKSCEVNTCVDCFNRLAYETVHQSQNQLSLQRAFFPPDDAPPVFVIVTYNYSHPNGSIARPSKKWFWSASTYYIFQPLAMLQFTSLLFADPAFRTERLAIILPTDCMYVGDNNMQLLTQRLQLFAQTRSMYPSISSDYQPKAESGKTLIEYFRKNQLPIKYLFATQFVFYLLSLIGTPFLVFYLLYGFPIHLKDYIVNDKISEAADNKKPKYWEKDTLIMAGGVLSWIFWLYAVALSSVGVHFQRNLLTELQDIHNEDEHDFRLLYGITIFILVENIFTIFFYSVVYAILIFYVSCKKEKCCGPCKKENCCPFKEKKNFSKIILKFAGILSLSLPITTLVVHFNHIVIAFIHNEYHATSVAFFYGCVIILHVIMFKILTHLYYSMNKSNEWILHIRSSIYFIVIYAIASIFLDLSIAFVATLYILLPINNAFDEAPDRLNSIFSTLILVFAGYIVFLLHKMNYRGKDIIFVNTVTKNNKRRHTL